MKKIFMFLHAVTLFICIGGIASAAPMGAWEGSRSRYASILPC
jgi:hypothetical protein